MATALGICDPGASLPQIMTVGGRGAVAPKASLCWGPVERGLLQQHRSRWTWAQCKWSAAVSGWSPPFLRSLGAQTRMADSAPCQGCQGAWAFSGPEGSSTSHGVEAGAMHLWNQVQRLRPRTWGAPGGESADGPERGPGGAQAERSPAPRASALLLCASFGHSGVDRPRS